MNIGNHYQQLHIAVVGSGPAGFYTAEELLSELGVKVRVDMFDRLATPWGLVRAGVAPDHPKIKQVSRVFERIADHPMFRFFGNVEVGTDVTSTELADHYHAVVYATGASTDRRLGIPGESLHGSYAATTFVGWYNGHPDHADLNVDLSGRRAIVVGNGNVALDVARMLALTPEELARTDIADHALRGLAASTINEIVVLGRRGPAQAAFTSVELRELGELTDADVIVDPSEIELDAASASLIDSQTASTRVRRNVEILRGFSQRDGGRCRKRIVLQFCASPIHILGSRRVTGLQFMRNRIDVGDGGDLTALPTGRIETIEADLVVRAIGYSGVTLDGVPYDGRRGVFPNRGGRVIDPEVAQPVPGLYAAGWVKRGPSGVIGTNKKCARETVECLLEDAANGSLARPRATADTLVTRIESSGAAIVDYGGWQAIDVHERGLGRAQGRPRVKLVRRDEILAHAFGGGGKSETNGHFHREDQQSCGTA